MLLYNFRDYHLLVAFYFIERMNLTLSLFLDIIYLHVRMRTNIFLCGLVNHMLMGDFLFES